MFKVFNALLIYMFIGGLCLTVVTNKQFKECKNLPQVEVAASAIFAWPAAVPISIFISDELVEHLKSLPTCKQEPK